MRRERFNVTPINRLGDYLLDLLRPILPLDPTIEFSFKSAAWVETRRNFANPGHTSVSPSTLTSRLFFRAGRRSLDDDHQRAHRALRVAALADHL